MTHEACPIPTSPAAKEQGAMQRMLAATRIAVVGASDDPTRAGNYVPAYLLKHGKQVLPVNPNHEQVLGIPAFKSLSDIKTPIDVVLVFRRPEFCPAVAEEAVRVKARGVWLQSGIRSEEARRIAEESGLDYVQDRCIMIEHMRQ